MLKHNTACQLFCMRATQLHLPTSSHPLPTLVEGWEYFWQEVLTLLSTPLTEMTPLEEASFQHTQTSVPNPTCIPRLFQPSPPQGGFQPVFGAGLDEHGSQHYPVATYAPGYGQGPSHGQPPWF